MIPLTISRRKFVRDLTRTRHMTLVSAVVLGTTFMPLLGVPEAYELRALDRAVETIADGRAHALVERRNDEAARQRSSRAMGLDEPQRPNRWQAASVRRPTVERPPLAPPDSEPVEVITAAEEPRDPLPAVADREIEPLAGSGIAPSEGEIDEAPPPVRLEPPVETREPAEAESEQPRTSGED